MGGEGLFLGVDSFVALIDGKLAIRNGERKNDEGGLIIRATGFADIPASVVFLERDPIRIHPIGERLPRIAADLEKTLRSIVETVEAVRATLEGEVIPIDVRSGAEGSGVAVFSAEFEAQEAGAGEGLGVTVGILVSERAGLSIVVGKEIIDGILDGFLWDGGAVKASGAESHESPTAARHIAIG